MPDTVKDPIESLIIGKNSEIKKLCNLVRRVARTDATVLIYGESGTGKELFARAIHLCSKRSNGPWVPVNCAAIPDTLLESELFGYVKGAFTGAFRSKPGRFQLAEKGTIFFDEIGEMPPALQVKLLRVLQDKQFEPVGGTSPCRIDFRVVAATNKDLEKEVKDGRFREDLFYRLNVIPIYIPPLRDRKDDIPILLEHFVTTFKESGNSGIEGFTSEAIGVLCDYPWYGNVRELENLVERVSVLKGEGWVDVCDLPPKYINFQKPKRKTPSPDDSPIDFNRLVSDFENELMLSALQKAKWNKKRAAQLLGLNRTTLIEKLKKKGLMDAGKKTRSIS
jgi:transcriptional regulator with PAS, ATPase and Fis domain